MDKADFLEKFKEAVEIENREIQPTDIFRDYDEWDSLANLSVIAMIDDEYDIVMDANTFAALTTIEELMEAIDSNKG